jgi:hypothetical protein
VAWADDRSGGEYDFNIYAQHVSGAGTLEWASNGVALCAAAGIQEFPNIVPDGAGGAIVAWLDLRADPYGPFDIYAQRISAAGTPQWESDGVALRSGVGQQAPMQQKPNVVPDGAGGAVVAWSDYRSGNHDMYAQRISSDGATQWTVNGVAACTAAGDQRYHSIDSDGTGGAIISWMDDRSGTEDIYAQRISGAGTVEFVPDGVAVCTAPGEQWFPSVVSDGEGGAIISWGDNRNGAQSDVYAQRVLADGQLGGGNPVTPTDAPAGGGHSVHVANPVVAGNVDVSFAAPAGRSVRIDLLDLAGRMVASRSVAGGLGLQTISLARSNDLAPGVYLVRVGLDQPVVARVAVFR